jgi:hypothetical protein
MGVGKSVPAVWSRYLQLTLRVLYSTSPSRLRPRRPTSTHGRRPCRCTPCLHAQVSGFVVEAHERNNVVEGGWKKQTKQANERRYCRCTVVVFLAGSDESRYPGSSDESPGDWHSYTSEDARGEKKAHPVERSRGLEPGVLPSMAGTASLLPTHEVCNKYMIDPVGKLIKILARSQGRTVQSSPCLLYTISVPVHDSMNAPVHLAWP